MQGVNWQTFCFHTFFFQSCLILRCRTSLEGFSSFTLENVDQKNAYDDEKDKVKILTSIRLFNECESEREREEKLLMQFEYCRQLRSKTNDKYYPIDVL